MRVERINEAFTRMSSDLSHRYGKNQLNELNAELNPMGNVQFYTQDKIKIGFIKLADLQAGKFNMFKFSGKPSIPQKEIPGHLQAVRGMLGKNPKAFAGDDGNFDFVINGGKVVKSTPDGK